MGYTPRVLVIGGGAVGTGVARDLAMRGLDVTLVERNTFANGTSGSMHALLHSGARYAVDDPDVAATCRRESDVLRTIAADFVTDTGGLFVALEGDESEYVEKHRAACESAGIPVESLSAAAAREREPNLSEGTVDATAVPDAVIDPFALCAANAISARDFGATVLTDTVVESIQTDDDAVDGVEVESDGKRRKLTPDYVVNAAGPWAGKIAEMAGRRLGIQHSQGAMLVVDRAGLDTVINRCRPRDEGDIAVPYGPSAILGTTDRAITSPRSTDRDPAEVDLLVDELRAVVPDVASARPFRAYWGVRALPGEDGDVPTNYARAATVVDHEQRDGLWGLSSVFGGKLTTHRATAERVADQVCAKFGIDRACGTADRELPQVPPSSDVESGVFGADPTLCETQGVSRSDVRSVLDHEVVSMGADLRPVAQLTGAGRGACQGARCAHRLAFEVHRGGAVEPIDHALASFADDRWAGRRHTLWHEGFESAMAAYDFHARTLARSESTLETTDTPAWKRFDAGRDGSDGEVTDV